MDCGNLRTAIPFLAAFTIACPFASASGDASASKPNVLIILADDKY